MLVLDEGILHDFVKRVNSNNLHHVLEAVIKEHVLHVRPGHNNGLDTGTSSGLDLGRDTTDGQHFASHGEGTCHRKVLADGDVFKRRDDSGSDGDGR